MVYFFAISEYQIMCIFKVVRVRDKEDGLIDIDHLAAELKVS